MIKLDVVAGILELIGLYVVGNKNRIGFIFNLLCNITWILYVFLSKSTYGLLIVILPAIFLNVRNFKKWRKTEWIKII